MNAKERLEKWLAKVADVHAEIEKALQEEMKASREEAQG